MTWFWAIEIPLIVLAIIGAYTVVIELVLGGKPSDNPMACLEHGETCTTCDVAGDIACDMALIERLERSALVEEAIFSRQRGIARVDRAPISASACKSTARSSAIPSQRLSEYRRCCVTVLEYVGTPAYLPTLPSALTSPSITLKRSPDDGPHPCGGECRCPRD